MSGGGVKSVIYLGAIKALEEIGADLHVIAGLSGGSLVASAYALGKTIPELTATISSIHLHKLMDKNPLAGYSLIDSNKFYQFVAEQTEHKSFADTKRKLIIFCTDIENGVPYVVESGEIASAAVASCALPPVFQPYARDSRLLVDGGFTIAYGAQYLRKAGAEIVIGLDVDGFANIHFPGATGAIGSLVKAISATIAANKQKKLQLDPVDMEIASFGDKTGMFEFQKLTPAIIDIGYNHTMAEAEHIAKLLNI